MKHFIKAILILCLGFSFNTISAAEFKTDRPEFYVVQPGDTLWDISQMFLNTPWSWPEIWYVNEQVGNPHLIFPGDIIALVYVDGKARLSIGIPEKENEESVEIKTASGVVKLIPKPRVLSSGEAISTLPLDVIGPFLTNAQIVSDDDDLDDAAYIVSYTEDRQLGFSNKLAYVRGIFEQDKDASKFTFYRQGRDFRDPKTGEYLGTEAVYLGEGLKIKTGDPATFRVTKNELELKKYDRAWPTNNDQIQSVYFPHAPSDFKGGQIVAVYGGMVQIGQYDVVVINRGIRDNIEVGHVLSIFKKGDEVFDEEDTARSFISAIDRHVDLPDEHIGRLMVFRTFEKVSLALVLQAKKNIHVNDKVTMPIE
ncbi:MAG: LysM peptidoglycan-binding domain-containing protein [Gammaproteobacteria bacterium]|nr:LysM peptidoglycan-binding domain-containing protein [Gammaproteobacteria bacterium]MDH5630114.1 LysM peptidoglycan-binding domain-containing protein [Gammaproteobacteria bacterium]